jgi:hypothetical protein
MRDGFMVSAKRLQEKPASILGKSLPTQIFESLPPQTFAHSFTRNRTHGCDFPPFFSPIEKALNPVARGFRMGFWQERRCSSSWGVGCDFS